MQIEFQTRKADYVNFYRTFFLKPNKRRAIVFLLISIFVGCVQTGSPVNWEKFFIRFFATFAVLFIVICVIPYFRCMNKLNKAIASNSSFHETKTLTTTQKGISIQSLSKTTELNWESIRSALSFDNDIQLRLVNKTSILVPKRLFASESDVINFLGLVQTEINKIQGTSTRIFPQASEQKKPPYLLGILGIIPLIGAFVGVGLLLYGLLKYKDKWLCIIGAVGIAWTVIVYTFLFPSITNTPSVQRGFRNIAQIQLNSVLKDVEFYKMAHGQYPDSLPQLLKDDNLAPINDDIQVGRTRKTSYFNYKKVGSKYLLFSSGEDGIPNTEDDLFPQVKLLDSTKIGLLKWR